jgi:hypothetical protein
MQSTPSLSFTITGRRYVVVSAPYRADHRYYLAGEFAAAGLDRVRETMAEANDASTGARDVFIVAARSGRLPWIAAGMLVEAGHAWTRRDAMKTAESFAALTETADVAAFDLAIAALLVGLIAAVDDPNGTATAIDLAALSLALDDTTYATHATHTAATVRSSHLN